MCVFPLGIWWSWWLVYAWCHGSCGTKQGRSGWHVETDWFWALSRDTYGPAHGCNRWDSLRCRKNPNQEMKTQYLLILFLSYIVRQDLCVAKIFFSFCGCWWNAHPLITETNFSHKLLSTQFHLHTQRDYWQCLLIIYTYMAIKQSRFERVSGIFPSQLVILIFRVSI